MNNKIIIKKNEDLGVYKVGDYKIGDLVKFKYDGEEDGDDILKIEGFSDDGKKVYGYFDSDDCGGEINYNWIEGKVE